MAYVGTIAESVGRNCNDVFCRIVCLCSFHKCCFWMDNLHRKDTTQKTLKTAIIFLRGKRRDERWKRKIENCELKIENSENFCVAMTRFQWAKTKVVAFKPRPCVYRLIELLRSLRSLRSLRTIETKTKQIFFPFSSLHFPLYSLFFILLFLFL